MSETVRTLAPVILIGLGVCWLIFSAVMLWRSRQQDRRWRHESQVHQRVSEFLAWCIRESSPRIWTELICKI